MHFLYKSLYDVFQNCIPPATITSPETSHDSAIAGLILGLHPANERRRYLVTSSLIGWAQA